MANNIKCPSCGTEIEISSALSETIKADLEKTLTQKILKESEAKFKQDSEEKFKQLEEEIRLKTEKLDEARKAELAIRQEKLKLEDEKKSFELDKQRQLDQEREKIRQQTLLEASDAHRMKDLEKEKLINDLKKSLEEAQLKATQSSQQLQGEVQELDLEEILKNEFRNDEINPVGKGVRGADITHTVKTDRGNVCGVILWESKRTKAWSDEWAQKLKEDLRSSKANIPIIVTTVMPKDIKTSFGVYDGVWVCEPSLVKPIAEIMRQRLIDSAREKFVSQNRSEKSEVLFSYIVSHEFRQQVESIVEVYQEMQLQISKERAAYEKIWKARESQSQRLLTSTANIVGSMQGIVGQSLPPVKGLDLIEE